MVAAEPKRTERHDLREVLSGRMWLRRSWPFPHVVASEVFTPAFYEALASELSAILGRGLSETPSQERFARNIAGYDAYGVGFRPGSHGALSIFLAPVWRAVLCELFGIGPTPYVFVGAHHHLAGGVSGFIHNDFNPVWFPRAGPADVRTPDNAICSYKTGAGTLCSDQKVRVVRGAAMLFYLCNDGWRSGDGGETGLYCEENGAVDEPAVACRPINNSLVAFECTPRSLHAFLRSDRRPRTSVVMWVHRSMEEAVTRHGEEGMEQWEE